MGRNMSMALRYLLVCLAVRAVQSNTYQAGTSSESLTNPIRKVVTMLQNIQKKVEEEGEEQKKLFEKFMCYCKSGGGSLQEGIEAAEAKIPQLTSDITSGEERKAQLEDEVKQHKADIDAATKAMEKATQIREKQSAAYKAYVSEAGVNMDAVNKAVAALTKGMGNSFLQSSAAQVVQKLAMGSVDLADEDRQDLMAFLSSSSSHAYSPRGGEIVGILKELASSLDKAIGKASRTEAADSKEYEELMTAKKKEVATLNDAVRTKTQRIGELAVKLVEMKEDLDDTQKGLANDQKFLANMKKSCSTKDEEYKKESQTRQEELLAIAETIKLLNDDDALQLFKKTLPSPASSFMQMRTSAAKVRQQVSTLLHKARSVHLGDPTRLDFILLALHGRKPGFDKIVAKIDTLVKELEREQDDDTKKKVYCQAAFDKTEDKSKSLERSISDTASEISDEKESISSLAEELTLLDKHIKNLDKEVAEATEQRKEEHSAYMENLAASTAAKQLLEMAKNRMQKFYGASLAQTTAEDELGDAPPPPPDVPSYKKKSVESRGVITMIATMIADIESDMAAMEAEEKDAQSDYESMMKDSKAKRAKDSKSVMSKEKVKADTKSKLGDDMGEKRSLTKDLMANEEHLASLHKACDWMLKNFDARKAARSTEVENLKNAKYVLAGVDASLLQARSKEFLGSTS